MARDDLDGAMKGVSMIARTWNGWTSPTKADDYRRHFEKDVSQHLRDIPGFCGARLLRRVDGDAILFTSITFFDGLDAVRAFAGENYERAVVEETARRALSRWDEQVTHHEVVVDLF